MSSHHFPHPYQNPEYAPPVLRAPSPASSVGTTYGPDQTSFSDTEQQLSQPAFEKKWLAKLDLDKPGKEEEEANESPLIARPEGKEEENAMVERIIKNLRAEIRQLEEDELFEQTLLRGSQVGLETRPSTNDIDALMRGMMGPGMSLTEGPTGKIFGRTADETLTDGPWNIQVPDRSMLHEGNPGVVGMESVLGGMTTASTIGKRSRNRKSRRVK